VRASAQETAIGSCGHPHAASDIDAGPAVRVRPGWVRDSLPDDVWAQLLYGDGALRGSLDVGAAVTRDSPDASRPLPYELGSAPEEPSKLGLGAMSCNGLSQHALMLSAPLHKCKRCASGIF